MHVIDITGFFDLVNFYQNITTQSSCENDRFLSGDVCRTSPNINPSSSHFPANSHSVMRAMPTSELDSESKSPFLPSTMGLHVQGICLGVLVLRNCKKKKRDNNNINKIDICKVTSSKNDHQHHSVTLIQGR